MKPIVTTYASHVIPSHRNFLNLQGVCQKHIDGLWIPGHLDDEQAAEFALDHFKRTLDAALNLGVAMGPGLICAKHPAGLEGK